MAAYLLLLIEKWKVKKEKRQKDKKYGRDEMRQAGTGWGCQMSDLPDLHAVGSQSKEA